MKLALELGCSEFKSWLCHPPVVIILIKLASLGPPFLIWKMRLIVLNFLLHDCCKDDGCEESYIMYDLQ